MPSTPLKMGFQRTEYSRFSFGRKRQHENNTSEQNKGLLKDINDGDSRSSYINYGEDDQMHICGYRKSVGKNAVTWFFVILTLGVLRLIFHWFPHWFLFATSSACPFDSAEKILIVESYKNKHKVYYVKSLQTLTHASVAKLKNEDDILTSVISDLKDVPSLLSVHFKEGIFKEIEKLLYFNCKKITYIYDPDKCEFVKLRGLDTGVKGDNLHNCRGLSTQDQFMRRLVYGPNEILIPEKSILTLLFLEVLNPFYIFQIMSFCFWFADDYYYYAVCILIMSAAGVIMSVHQTRKNQKNLKSTVHSSDVVTVVRGRSKSNDEDEEDYVITTEAISTRLLVPGDVLEIPTHGCIMHCDAVLLTGNCIVNESMLTGESVPVTKTPIPNAANVMYDSKEHSRHTLYCGTQVIQTRYFGNEKVLAVVIRTGFTTAKGGLVRSILYPPPVDFRFEKDSYRFVGLLAAIASIGFIYTVITKYMRGVHVSDLLLEALDLVTIVVPPALPAAMTVGRLYAQKRLKSNNIYCISPRTINVSGSIDCVCFDKTGTLTEDGLDMLCVVPVSNKFFELPIQNMERMNNEIFFNGMVTCHSLTIIDKQLTGDPLDLKMFECTKWVIEEHETSDNTKFNMIFPTVIKPPHQPGKTPEEEMEHQIGIIREFPFSSSSQRMSVITRKLTGQYFEYYCKGSPEMILNFVNPETVPDDFHYVLETYTQQGYRVIALAYKELRKMSYAKVQKVQRDVIECDMNFLGFIVLENRLKEDTSPCITMLNNAKIRTIMVTGDNILTAVSVAKECGIVSQGQSVITVNVDSSSPPQIFYTLTNTKNRQMTNGCADYSITDSASIVSVETVESAMITNTQETTDFKKRPQNLYNNYRFALTGKVWASTRQFFPELIPKFVTRGAIFARMSPEQKQQLIEELQTLGYYVAMCGDGANDCGALKAAHTGISLSDAESSVASPFTSKNPNITCVPNIIKEGRAALVTSFGIFKYMASYSLCQFISVMILYSIDSNLSDIQYLYIDLFIISIFAFFFGKTKAYSGKLVKETPLSSLISLSPVLSLLLHLVLIIVFQVIAFEHVQQQDWFVPYNSTLKDESPKHYGYENYMIFSVSSFQYIILAVVFSKGKPYRQSVFSNYGFIISAIGMAVFSAYLVIYPIDFLKDSFDIDLPEALDFRFVILGYALVHFIIATFVEIVIIDHFVFKKLRFKFHNISTSKRKYLAVEHELQQDTKWPTLTSDFKSFASPLSSTQTPKYTAEIVIENENTFSKNHVFNNIFPPNQPNADQPNKQAELQLNPLALTENYADKASKIQNTLSCDDLDRTRVVTEKSKVFSESVPNISNLNSFATEHRTDEPCINKSSILEMNNIERR